MTFEEFKKYFDKKQDKREIAEIPTFFDNWKELYDLYTKLLKKSINTLKIVDDQNKEFDYFNDLTIEKINKLINFIDNLTMKSRGIQGLYEEIKQNVKKYNFKLLNPPKPPKLQKIKKESNENEPRN